MAMVAAALLILLLAAPAAYATQYTVGESSGWAESVNYANWVSGKTFTVGDSLLFSYGPSHSVDIVSQSDYNSCNSANAIKSYSGGPTTINLNSTSPMYFICPTSNHCQNGMKLAVTNVATNTSPSGSPSSPPGTSSSPPPPPPNSGATKNFGDKNFMVLGFSLLVGAVIALVG